MQEKFFVLVSEERKAADLLDEDAEKHFRDACCL